MPSTAERLGYPKDAPVARTICVDWNGVLDTYTGWRGEEHFDPPRPGAREFLEALRTRFDDVVVLSSREPEAIWGWLRQWGLDRLVDRVTSVKVPAVAYIDDRAIRFAGDFAETLRELDAFRAHWEAEGEEP